MVLKFKSNKVTVKGQHKDTGLIEREKNGTISVSKSGKNKTATINFDTTNINYLHIYVDTDNAVADEPATNNYVLRPFVRQPVKAYLEVDTGYDKADQAIENYMELSIDRQSSQSTLYLNIIIGKFSNTFRNTVNTYTKDNLNNPYHFEFFGRAVKYNNNYVGTTPYSGIVGGFKHSNGRRYVVAYGNDIDGDIAAIKKLISARDLFLTTSSVSFDERTALIDDFDVTGLSVMDLFHNQENKQFYNNRGSDSFKAVVERILTDNNFEIAIKTVRTTNDNTTLRLKNVNTDYSSDFKDAIVKISRPVVLARGVWSNLLTWETLGKKLASDPENARNTWLIEITGGPKQDCPTCPNYEYEDLTDYYWPALIAGVEQYSGQNTIDYVGHSNACRVALDSLKNWSSGKNNAGYCFNPDTGLYDIDCDLAANAINTFVGVGCPGAFEGSSLVKELFNDRGDRAISNLNSNNVKHISMSELLLNEFFIPLNGVFINFISDGNSEISTNLFEKYNSWANSNNDQQPSSGLSKFNFSELDL